MQITSTGNEVGSIAGEGGLTLTGGSLELVDGSTVSEINSLSLEDGTLTDPGSLDIFGSLETSGYYSAFEGSGSIYVESGATGGIDDASCSLLVLNEVTFVNDGTLTMGASGGSSGQIDMEDGAKLENMGTFNADAYSSGCVTDSNNAAIQSNDASTLTMDNTGTFNVNVGNGNAAAVDIPFNNRGTVDVQSGTFSPTGGDPSIAGGTWTTAGESSVSIPSGSYSLANADASGAKFVISGNGTLDIPSGTSTTVEGLSLANSGTLDTSGTVEIGSSLSTSGSPLVSGPGRVVVQSGATGTIDDASCTLLTLSNVTFVNNGTVTLGSSGGTSGQIDMEKEAQLQNAGTFNADSYPSGCISGSNSASVLSNDGSTLTVVNTGTFDVNVGSGNAFTVNIPFNSKGTVDVQSGTMQLSDGGSGSGDTWSVASGSSLGFMGGSFSLPESTWIGSGTVSIAGATVTAVALQAVDVSLSSGSLVLPKGSMSSVSNLDLGDGTLSVSETLDVDSSLSTSGYSTINGSGSVVIEPGASGTIDNSACLFVTITGTTLVNDGTMTMGASGGLSGEIVMEDGAKIENTGTFNADAYASGCVPGDPYIGAIQDNGGSTPTFTNTGTVNSDVGSGNAALIDVPFANEGTVKVHSGILQLGAGGIGEQVESGTWLSESGPAITFSNGTFMIFDGTNMSAVVVEPAARIVWIARGLTGSLDTLPSYVSGEVAVDGSGESGIGGPFEGATVEVASAGSETWYTLCGSLTPSLIGGFECTWVTDGGGYPDGYYELRAKMIGGASETVTTSPMSVMVDNTPPTGSITAPPSHGVGGSLFVAGTANDGGSGVQSWQPEIAPEGSSEWTDACSAQTIPIAKEEYGCRLDTTKYTNGTYQLRATISDNAGNTHVTSAADLHVANEVVYGTLEIAPSFLVGTLTVEGKAEAKSGSVESWEVQISHIGASSWSAACPVQSTPISGTTYGCSIDTSGLTDGYYELQVVVTGDSGDTYTTVPAATMVDNTPPTGGVTPVETSVSGIFEAQGDAYDTGSGVAEWALEVTPAGASSWKEACTPQTVSILGSIYGCDVEAGRLTDGEYELRATIKDRAGNTYTTSAVSFTVGNTAPSSTVSPSISGRTIAGHTLSAAKGSWSGASPMAYAYQWQDCNTSGEDCTDISGATEFTYLLNSGDVGKTVRVVVSATNAAGESSVSSAASTVVLANTLANITAPRIAGSPESGGTLIAGPGEWSGVSPFAFAYQWQLCDSKGESCSNITGATAQHYTLGEADLSGTLRVIVIATNSEGSADTTSAASAVIASGSGPGIRYLYDEAGRLHIVDDPSQGAAVYEWDADGNLLSIKRYSKDTVSVLAVTPSHAPPGARVDITGTGYSAEASHDSVTFNGVSATVDEASATDLIVTVPEGASEGAITVTVGEESAKSSGDFAPNVARLHEGQATPPVVSLAAITPPSLAATNPSTVTQSTVQHSRSTAKVLATHCAKKQARAKKCKRSRRKTITMKTRIKPSRAGKREVAGRACSRIVSKRDGRRRARCATRGHSSRRPVRARRATHPPAAKTSAQHTTAPSAPGATPTSTSTPVQSPPSAQELSSYKTPYSETWTPGASNRKDYNWATGRARSPWERLPGLTATHGGTGLSGQALAIDGMPLANVTLSIQGTSKQAKTDRTGRFLLDGLPAGQHVLVIDGETADEHSLQYGRFTAGVEITHGKISPLGYTIWMTPLEAAGEKTIPESSKHETVLTNPHIPGLEVRLPAGTVVRSSTGALVRKVNLTAIPVDRPPFPLPLFTTDVPTYFTVQPGGAYLSKGAQIIYPNWGHLPPGQRVEFWNYDPTGRGWYVYGKGTVSANGQQVIPDPNVRVWEFTGAMISSELEPPKVAPVDGASVNAGDPVDLATGLFVYQHTDLSLPDSLMSLALTRTYRPGDDNSYSFGIGTQNAFDMHLWSDENYRKAFLVLPDGSKIQYVRTSSGNGYVEAEYAAVGTSGQWQGSTMRWNDDSQGWALERRDGIKFIFGDVAPLQYIEDRNGNRITLVREDGQHGQIVQIRGPHDHWIDLSYDSYGRIIRAGDDAGQTVRYEYDTHGRLVRVIDPMGRVTRYDYDSDNEMTKVIDARGDTLIENTYEYGNRVVAQKLGEQGTYRFSYGITYCGIEVACHDRIPNKVVTPTGLEREVVFDDDGTLVEEIEKGGSSPTIKRSYERDGNENVVLMSEGDKTVKLTYDDVGDVTKVEQINSSALSGEHSALTTSLAYNEFAEPTSITDSLGRTTRYDYDTNGNLTAITDPMGRSTTFGHDGEGELTSETDPDGHTVSYKYEDGHQVGVTNPLGAETQISYNGIGQPLSVRDPEGRVSEFTYDQDNELTSETNPAGEKTTYGYDADGNLVSVTDPREHTQTATYNKADQLASSTNALEQTTSYTYDGQGRLTSTTDPKGQKTSYSYDSLDRLESISFGPVDGGTPTSSITYGYDAEGNLTSVKDSRGGNYTLGYDLDHQLTSETGPNGTVGYSYDADGEPTGMTINEKEAASYHYNEDGQLTSIETPNGNVSLVYDPDGLNTQTVLPDGDSENYSYDAASQLAGIDYENPEGGQIGSLQYARDALGRVTTISGSLARTGLPEAISDLSYNAANELTSSEGHSLEYDADGNLTKDASSTYTYNDRNQLTELVQGSNKWSFNYDPFGREQARPPTAPQRATSTTAGTSRTKQPKAKPPKCSTGSRSTNATVSPPAQAPTPTSPKNSAAPSRSPTAAARPPPNTPTTHSAPPPAQAIPPPIPTNTPDAKTTATVCNTTAPATTTQPPPGSQAKTRSDSKAAAPTSTPTPQTTRSTTPTPPAIASSKNSAKASPASETWSQAASHATSAANSASDNQTSPPEPTRPGQTPESSRRRSHQETRRQPH